jgi:hypothetical protein
MSDKIIKQPGTGESIGHDYIRGVNYPRVHYLGPALERLSISLVSQQMSMQLIQIFMTIQLQLRG